MKRSSISPRSDWQRIVEEQGLTFHTLEDGSPYWDESACYEFSSAEVDMLEAAANEMQQMCLAAAQHVIDNERYDELEIAPEAVSMIEWAWEQEPPAIYGRFDFSYDGVTPPKLLEYNADTPTALLEAAVIQWTWMEQVRPGTDQFNSIHDRLIAKWKDVAPYLSKPVYFASVNAPEDLLTATYLRDTAEQAGIPTGQLLMEEIGWDNGRRIFVDLENRRIDSIFKLYPWETMVEEEFGASALEIYQDVKWIEPIWKMLLSNKGILPILWELYPDHPNLLPAYFADLSVPPAPGTVRKPMHSREGANITLVRADGTVYATEGDYTDRLCVDQALSPPAIFDGRYPVLGLWMIDQECGGMGIRESSEPVTGNFSRFVPHLFR